MSVRPRAALLGALLTALVLYLLTVASGVAWLALGSAAALALPVTSLLVRPQLAGLEVVLVLPHRVTVGDLVAPELRVRNTGGAGVPATEWACEHPALGPLGAALPRLAPGEQVRVALSAVAEQRGVHEAAPAQLSTSAPFGLLRWSRDVPPSGALIVHPRTTQVHALEAEGAPTAAERSVPVAGMGSEVLGLRPYRQGDSLRHVSARASARHGRPVVLERERETGPSLVLLATGGGAGEAWERAISTAAALALAALREGTAPLLLADPAPGRLDPVGVLDFFAGVDGAGPLRAEDLRKAVAACGPGGTVLLLAPAGATEQHARARAAGARVVVLS